MLRNTHSISGADVLCSAGFLKIAYHRVYTGIAKAVRSHVEKIGFWLGTGFNEIVITQ